MTLSSACSVMPATEYWNRNSSWNFTSVYLPPAVTGAWPMERYAVSAR